MSDETELTVWRGVEAAAVLLVLGFFLYATRTILNPLLLLFLLWAVLLPFRGKEGHSALLVTASVLAMIWLLSTTGSLLAPFVLAVVLAYALDPVVDVLERRRVPRSRPTPRPWTNASRAGSDPRRAHRRPMSRSGLRPAGS